jgi:hypothetical protein
MWVTRTNALTHSASCRPPLRRPLHNRRGQIHLRPPSLSESHAPSRTTSYQRPIQSRPCSAIWRSWYGSFRCVRVSCALTTVRVDFNLDFYTEVQDLSHLENALSSASPRYAAMNMAICSLIEDFGLVGFETLAVEVGVLSALHNHPTDSDHVVPSGQGLDAPPDSCH